MKSISVFAALILSCSVHAQFQIKDKLNWNTTTHYSTETNNLIPLFDHSQRHSKHPDIPKYVKVIDLPSDGYLNARLITISESKHNLQKPFPFAQKFNSYQLQATVEKERKAFKAVIELTPLKFNTETDFNYLTEFEIQLDFIQKNIAASPAPPNKFVSELSDGLVYKIAIPARGIYKIDRKFFQDHLKINVGGVDPRNIRLLGNGGARIPEKISTSRIDDLQENRILFQGESDGIFDDQDFILFYAAGPDQLQYNESDKTLSIDKNPYSQKSYYYIKLDNKPGLRISKRTTGSNPEYLTDQGIDIYHHEKELINLLDDDECNHGSGQTWYGEELSNSRQLDLSKEVFLNNLVPTVPCRIRGEFATRSTLNSTLKITLDNQVRNFTLGASPFSCTSQYAASNNFSSEVLCNNTNPTTLISFPSTGVNSEGWLNFLSITYAKKLNYGGNGPLWIFDPEAFNKSTNYSVKTISNIACEVWDITDPYSISSINSQIQNSVLVFNTLKEARHTYYTCFRLSDRFESPEFIGLVENQNIHGLDKLDLVLIYHSSLKTEAERLLKHRTTHSKLNGIAVDIDHIYNEFGSGSKDPTALRDFAKMLYSRSQQFKYMILFGTASYDYRHLAPNTKDYNLVPTYETTESLDPILSYPSDDYFGLLDDTEGTNLVGLLDIEIGRILARSPEEAMAIVDKIVRYDTDPKILGDWKLNLLFNADDEDGNAHITDVDKLANYNNSTFPLYNQQKIYLDAFEQISTPGGERYPDVNKAITDEIFRGAFVVSYLGHGGPTGLAQERILQENDIKNWDNEFKPPLLITATCSFTPFDDPKIFSAGAQTQIQKNGSIALYSTVRAVYANENYRLTNETLAEAFSKTDNKFPTLGDMLRVAKNKGGASSENNRKYSLFGDPAQKLAYPILETEISSVNGKALNTQDTFKALQSINIKGIVKAENGGIKNDFNGKLYITIFDKPVQLKTRGNNGSIPFSYQLQRNIIFKGIAQITNGEWSVDFIIPKDINYVSGQGKISLYATNEKDMDAAGYSDKFVIGGFSKDPNKDDQPPIVKLFINNNEFVNGGICNENPKIYAELLDDYGINITGNSIGHDLVAILDGNVQNPIVLNTFFKSQVNSSREGTVEYPLKSLSVGKHTLSLTAWDISNNRGIGNLEFNVISSDDVNIEKVYNYPNPFNKKTNFQFETNYINLPLDITIQIQSISGKVVKTIQEKITPTGYRITSLEWDGKDDLGNDLANGVYLYRIGLHHSSSELILTQKSEYQKLLILR